MKHWHNDLNRQSTLASWLRRHVYGGVLTALAAGTGMSVFCACRSKVAQNGVLTALAVGTGMSVALAADAASPIFTNYVETVPGQSFSFEMVPIPGGTITVGSPENEGGRDKSDLPQKKVTVKPFWMGKYEVSWQEYYPYVFVNRSEIVRDSNKIEGLIDKDGVSHPTKPYGSPYRERGEKGFPAIGMGWPGASEYCKWLSQKTGHKYRLPTEEEWEYACRAGAATAYFWGNDPAQAKDYAWSKESSGDTTHPLGKLKPNKFGLFDIVGNVGEWCAKASTNDPGVLRGGAFTEPATKLRSASRMIQTPEWNEMDPQFPQSVWWLASADFVGFRVVRSLDEEGDTKAAAPPAAAATAMAAVTDSAAVDGKAAYTKFRCALCHGADGKGDTAQGRKHKVRDYTDAKVKATLKDEAMIKAIKEGITVDDQSVMPKYATASEAEIKAMIEYMKKF